jgi:D-xylono/L-arabinono-1,4-lactonase
MIDVDLEGVEPRLVADYRCVVGEGPVWHPDERALYWLDIPEGKIFRYSPVTGKHETVYDGRPVGGMTLQEDGSFLLFMDRGSIAVWRGGSELDFVVDQIERELDSRFNDVIADPMGRVFCGTMTSPGHPGNLYRLDTDGSLRVVVPHTGTPNGLGFTGDRRHMFFTDTGHREIYRFEYDEKTGEISGKATFVTSPAEGDGKPDGMTVDSEDHVWSARWDGWILARHAPDGSEDLRIAFPAKKISSVTFGGDNLTDIYVTSAGGQDRKENGAAAGALFHFNIGLPGRLEFRSRVN